MAVDAGTSLTYDVASNREDLTDVIYNVDPTDTPFITRVMQGSATARKHEWPIDTLTAASADNAVAEGDEATIDNMTDPVRRDNETQLSDKTPSVSSTQQAVDSAGVDDYFDYQIVKATKELRRDMESSLLANKAKNAGSRGVARVLAGIESWIATNWSTAGTGGSPAAPAGDGTNTRTAATTPGALTEDPLYTTNLSNIWTNGGQPDMTMVGAYNKGVISGFAGRATRIKEAEDRTLIATIDIYDGDFSQLEIIANRWQNAGSVLNLQSDMWATSYLQPVGWEYLAKRGHSDEALVSVEYTLESRNEKASGGVFDCTTSSS